MFDENHLKNLKNVYAGYSKISALSILDYLCTTCVEAHATDLKKSATFIEKSWDLSTPIENLFKEIEDG